MDIHSLLLPSLTLCQHPCSSKKRVLEDVASLVSEQFPSLDANEVFSALIARERLGSTGIGGGIAIPHCRIKDCSRTTAVLITLESAIDFNAIDSKNVDIIFVLLVPENQHDDHLKTLASIAEKLSDSNILKNIRAAKSNTELFNTVNV